MAVEVVLGGNTITRRDIASISIDRGRNSEFEETPPGTAKIDINIVENRDNPVTGIEAGADAQVYLRNPVTSSYHQLIDGVIDRAEYDIHPSLVVTKVTFYVVDGLDMIQRCEIAPGDVGDPAPAFGYEIPVGSSAAGQVFYEDTGQVKFRIEKALLEAGWDPSKQQIFTGNVGLQEMLYSGRTSLLQVIRDAADAEFPDIANFFNDKFGIMRFKGRLARFNPTDPQYDVLFFPAGASSASHAQIRGITTSNGRDMLCNAALCTPKNILEKRIAGQRVLDQGSIDAFGAVYSWSAEDLLTDTGFLGDPNRTKEQETKLFGQWRIDNYAYPRTRVDRLNFKSIHPTDYRAAATWDLLCNIDISHVVDLALDAPGLSFDEGFFVEGLSYVITPNRDEFANVSLDLDLSPRAYYEVNPF